MKIKDIKKYVIWFILWLSLIGWLVFAADSWSIGALFTTDSSWKWVLKGENIQNDSVEWSKLKDWIDWNKISIWTISANKLDTNVNTLLNKTVPTSVSQLSDASSYIKTWDDVSVKSLTINWELLQKKFSVIDQTFYPVLNFSEGTLISYTPTIWNITSFTVPIWKYISAISISSGNWSNSSDCSVFVNNKLWLSVSRRKSINYIDSTKIISTYNWYSSSTLVFSNTKIFDIKNLVNDNWLSGNEFTYWSYIYPWVKYLEWGDTITLYHNADYAWRNWVDFNFWWINCSVSVQYWEFIY